MAQWVLEKTKIRKVYDDNDANERQQTEFDHKIPLVSGELKTKNFDEKKNQKVFVVVYK